MKRQPALLAELAVRPAHHEVRIARAPPDRRRPPPRPAVRSAHSSASVVRPSHCSTMAYQAPARAICRAASGSVQLLQASRAPARSSAAPAHIGRASASTCESLSSSSASARGSLATSAACGGEGLGRLAELARAVPRVAQCLVHGGELPLSKSVELAPGLQRARVQSGGFDVGVDRFRALGGRRSHTATRAGTRRLRSSAATACRRPPPGNPFPLRCAPRPRHAVVAGA